MRAVMALFLALGIVGTSCSAAEGSGFVFGVKPGNTINSAYFGYKFGNIVPMVGADILWLSASGTYTDENVDRYYDDYDDVWREHRSVESVSIDGEAFLVMPHLGGKLYFGSKDVKPYLYANFFFSIPSVKAEAESKDESWYYYDGELIDYYVEDAESLSKEYKDLIEDVLGFWGITLGGGAEYFFGEHFSVGGEYGIRIIANSIDQSSTTDEDYGTESYTEQVDTEVSASVKVSYAIVTLNYHF
jgi:hypothetical protein